MTAEFLAHLSTRDKNGTFMFIANKSLDKDKTFIAYCGIVECIPE